MDRTLKGEPLRDRAAEDGSAWKVDRNPRQPGLHKKLRCRGRSRTPFLDPFLRWSGRRRAWNEEVNRRRFRTLERFDRMWAKFFRVILASKTIRM